MKTSKQNHLIGWAVGASLLCASAVGTLPLASDALAAGNAATAEEVTRARALQLEGTQLQLKGDLEGAIGMYTASNALNPNPRIESLISTLERQVTIQKKAAVETPAVIPAETAQEQAEVAASTSEPKTTAEMIKQAVQNDTAEAAAVAAAVETIQQAAPEQETVPVQHSPASPEEALVYEFVDWMLQLFQPGEEIGLRLDTNRNYTISQADGKYQVTLEPFRVHVDDELSVDGGPLVFNFQPDGTDRLSVDMQVSPNWSIIVEGEISSSMTIKNQNITGVWDRTTRYFDKADLQLDEIVIKDKTVEGQFAAQQLLFGMLLAPGENGTWQEQYEGSVKGISLVVDDVNLAISNIGLFSGLTGTDYAAYKDIRKEMQIAGEAIDEDMELAEAKILFTSLDTFLQLLTSYETRMTVDGVALDVDETMRLDGMELYTAAKKDPKTNKFVANSKMEMRGISFAEKKSEHNQQPLMFSLDQAQVTDDLDFNPISPTLFADIYTVLEKAEAMKEEQEMESYLANEGMTIAKKVVALLGRSYAELSLKGMSVTNVMPEPITLGTAIVGGGFTGSTGSGSTIDLKLGFSDFNGMDPGMNVVPHAANLNFSLANIPSILNLISDPGVLAQGDMDQVQGQVMMNGMGAVMGSALAFSLKDSFVALPTTRVDIDLAAAVNGAAKFMSTGTMKLAIENPDAFMETATNLGADPGILQLMTSLTAMANRTDDNGKIVDSIDASVNEEGKVFVNKKDVTLMFFPDQGAADGQQAAPAQQ